MKYIEEPWDYRGDLVYFPKLRGGFSVGNCPHPETIAKRIVACVNACVGLDTDDLMDSDGAMTESLLNSVSFYKKQRDELLTALYQIATGKIVGQPNSHKAAILIMRNIANEAIAKAGVK